MGRISPYIMEKTCSKPPTRSLDIGEFSGETAPFFNGIAGMSKIFQS